MSHWIILDRDGVINQDSVDYIKSPAEWIAIARSLDAIALMNEKGYLIAVATNQSGIARKYYTLETLERIHQKMHTEVQHAGGKIACIAFCPHGPKDDCDCRKPKPGLLKKLAQENNIDLEHTFYVGDSYRDIEAARAAKAKPALVKTGNGAKTFQEKGKLLMDCSVFADLMAFAEHLPQLENGQSHLKNLAYRSSHADLSDENG